jgi:hypothetical protein
VLRTEHLLDPDAFARMTSFPIFQRLVVSNYGLYPGTPRHPGLDVTFEPGLTLVLGANGLGKTTLVALLYRMCTGPFDIPGLARSSELGGRRLDATRVGRTERRLLAERVLDDAADASATLTFSLDDTQVEVTRSLASLALTGLVVDSKPENAAEDSFHEVVLQHAGLGAFGDWVLLLRHLTFYFEDRRALVWDPSAQRQILRLLFLPPDVASEWRTLERDISERDSRVRNMQAVLTREETELAQTEGLINDSDAVREELKAHQQLLAIDEGKVAALNDKLPGLDAARHSARLEALKAEDEQDAAHRDLERRQLLAVAATFPTADETAQYLLGTLFADEQCLVCGAEAPGASADLRERLAAHKCVVCGADLQAAPTPIGIGPRAIKRATTLVVRTSERVAAAKAEQAATESAFQRLVSEIQELGSAIADRRARVDVLVAQLPPEEAELHEQRSELAALRSRVELMRRELETRRDEFTGFITGVSRKIVRSRGAIRARSSNTLRVSFSRTPH